MNSNMSFEERQVYWCHPCKVRGHCADSLNCPTELRFDEEQAERANTQRTNTRNSGGASRFRAGPERSEQPVPKREDFMVTTKKDMRKVPAPMLPQQPTAWTNNGLERNRGINRVSAPFTNAWAEIEDTSRDLFGRTPAQMLALCEKFVAPIERRIEIDKHIQGLNTDFCFVQETLLFRS